MYKRDGGGSEGVGRNGGKDVCVCVKEKEIEREEEGAGKK